jgi:hypothetical protein
MVEKPVASHESEEIVATLALGRDQGKGLQGCGPRGKFESEGKCEGMNPHAPKGASTLGVGVPVHLRMFRERLQGLKPNGSKNFIYHWKFIET